MASRFIIALCIFNIQIIPNIYAMNNLRSICPTAQTAQLCSLNLSKQLCVQENVTIGGDLTVNGIINGLAAGAAFGNVERVDQVFGSDVTGTRNGQPFQTIGAALAVAQPGDVVWVFPGVYNETITIPANVNVRGLAPHSVTIQQLNVAQPTTLVTMEEGSVIHEIELLLTSSLPVQLHGIVIPHVGPEAGTRISATSITVNNLFAVGSSDVFGIHYTGSGASLNAPHILNNVFITILSSGGGSKRGILVDNSNLVEIITPLVQMVSLGPVDSIAIEVNNPAAFVASQGGAFGGVPAPLSTPDISQTQGTLGLASTYLINSEANELGFLTLIYPNGFTWGIIGLVGGGQVLFMTPGASTGSNDPFELPASQKFLAKALTVHAETPPGIGESTTVTLQKNGTDTGLVAILTDDNEIVIVNNISVHFDLGDEISVKIETSAGAATANVSAIVDIY